MKRPLFLVRNISILHADAGDTDDEQAVRGRWRGIIELAHDT
jgi:hypothetical protein